MWLLKLHFSISVLLVLMLYGFARVYKNTVKENGWINEEDRRKKRYGGDKNLSAYFVCFIPVMNILQMIAMFMMIFVKKKDFDKMLEESKQDREEG